MARAFLAADGNEWYHIPTTPQEANEWLRRAGVNHIKFGTRQGKAVLKNALVGTKYNNIVYLEADKVKDLCLFLATAINQMRAFGIPYRDWWLSPNEYLSREITIYGHCDGKTQRMVSDSFK